MEKSKTSSPTEQMDIIIKNYLASNPVARMDGKENEVEVRFGTNARKHKPFTKIDYDNVVKKLYATGFKCENTGGTHSLRIFHEFIDKNSGKKKMSNIRAEINGIDLIQEYCKTNSIQKLLDMPSTTYDKIIFNQKSGVKMEDGSYLKYADFEDFNMRVAYQLEQRHTARAPLIRSIISKWSDSKKTFRYLNRVRFSHADLPVFADLSIVQKSATTNGIPIKDYTVQDVDLFENPESYEIEMELDNSRIGIGTDFNDVKTITNAIRKFTRIIMSGLQGTNYPISYSEQFNVQQEYMKILNGDDYQPRKMRSRDFTGPSSYTLQLPNIMEPKEGVNIPNVRNDYTVTDKADGDRSLLFINGEGKIYLINTNLSVMFTGSRTKVKEYFNSVIDGEHITQNKHDTTINLYAAFDIYCINKKSTRALEFYPTNNPDEEPPAKPKVYRLQLLKKVISELEPVSITKNGKCEISITCKKFYATSETRSIFNCCSKILGDVGDGLYEYNTDGLIFTPSRLAVGSSKIGEPGPITKTTWEHSFKWKPSEYNTIDFLVSVKKDKTGKDDIHNIFQDGVSTETNGVVTQYKTLILRCGYDEKKHGFINPCEDMIQNRMHQFGDVDVEDGYKPVPFQPTNPYDKNACYANIILKSDGSDDRMMFTDEGEYFEEDMIVEFSYDITKSDGWKWTPLRVRYDKTAELRNGQRNYGNAYHVANSNWQSIHQPIGAPMISTGENIPEYIEEFGEEENGEANEGVYYNRRDANDKRTKSMRDFHNLFVKNKLIRAVSNRNDTLIDYAVGKGGDLPKWIYAKLGFVFGIDISRDNIQNRMDGACARYLKYRKTHDHNMPGALFVNGNSSLLIRTGDALLTDKDKEITKAVFGKGPKDADLLGAGVYKHYGVASDGFNVSSCQFALHYFFENRATLHRFVRNLSECTKLNGYFIGTCYDGETVFNKLKGKNKGDSIIIMNGEEKRFELTKMFNQTGFQDDDTSLGYKINVYQDTIGKTFHEYLVNFNYFIRVMSDYGFELVSKEVANQKGLPDGTGLFGELFNSMNIETNYSSYRRSNYKSAHLMTDDEKQISFMNRYFVFIKARNADVSNIYNNITHKTAEEIDIHSKPDKIVIKKRGKKVLIKKT